MQISLVSESFYLSVDMETIQKHTYPSATTNLVKLHKKTDLECVIEPIEKAREELQSCFKSKKKLIGFRADTGIGKTFLGIQLYQIKGIGGFISTPTTDLA